MNSSFLAGGPPFSVESFAKEMGVSTWSTRRLLPKIGYVRIGGLIRIPRENVEAYLRARYVPPTETVSPRRRRGEPGQLAVLADAAFGKAKGRGR